MLGNMFKAGGVFHAELVRDGKVVASSPINFNGITTEGLNKVLDVMFRNQTQIATWYTGLIDSASFSALAAGDVMNSHAGWIESDDYSDTTRRTWSPGAASGGVITNGTAMAFNMNGTVTVKGVFITSVNTKNGTTGVLWATALLTTPMPAINGDLLNIIYTLTATSS